MTSLGTHLLNIILCSDYHCDQISFLDILSQNEIVVRISVSVRCKTELHRFVAIVVILLQMMIFGHVGARVFI